MQKYQDKQMTKYKLDKYKVIIYKCNKIQMCQMQMNQNTNSPKQKCNKVRNDKKQMGQNSKRQTRERTKNKR